MKMKRILLGFLAVMFSGLALAQTVVPPFMTGTETTYNRSIFEVGMLRVARNTAMTALAGGAQAGTALSMGMNRFSTVATGGDSAQLPQVTGGVAVIVVNATATSMNVFGQTGQTINALSANAAFAVAAGKTAIFVQAIDGSWYAILSA